MSDRRPDPDRPARRDPPRDDPPDWLEHEGSSVFSTPPSSSRPPRPPTAADGDWHERTRRQTPWADPPSRRRDPQPPRPPDARPAPGAPPPAREAWPPPPARRPPDDPWGPPPEPRRHDPARGPGPYGDGRPPGRPGTAPYDPAGRPRRPPPAGEPPPAPGRSGRDTARGGFRSPIGLGAAVGIPGAVAFVAALVVLPWFTAAGRDVTLSDIRSAYDIAATDPASLPGSGGTTDSTLPGGQLPTTDQVADVVEDQVRDAAAAAAAQAIDGGKARYLELYVDTLWLPVAAVVAVAAVVSTLLAPRSAALSLLLGVRRLAGSLVVLAGLAHAAALWIVFTGDGAPSPAPGVWIGVGGLVAVLVGCVIGPRR